MPETAKPSRAYSRAELRSDAVVHVTGLTLALVAVPALIVVTALWRGDALAMTATAIYGTTLLAMLVCSALYNMVESPEWIWLLRRLDHGAIYLKIAGTYTPFALISGQGLGLTAGLWAAALAGVGLKAWSPSRFRWPGLALYLGMGWAGVVLGGALLGALSGPVVALMIVGGGLYSAGVVFHLWRGLRFHNTIWHVFVLAATLVFYAAVMVQVVS